ncbi:hypothetical protein KUL150_22130 [Alteromonas sp. KUL150]|uniref:cupin domain-containing protein n=1 Tax=Alteromonas sp. KUL150 TaxID=2480805 RepID=UPI0012E51FB2|nr:cupin domain-containing protein [Alteromonas sp. KUL150]GFD86154.1 hypothetical protein KUL150_22130 [Alteromonas sp. KUL150]
MKNTKALKQSPLSIAESLCDYWSPRVIDQFEDCYIKVAKLKGSLTWHSHEFEDEVFFILKGYLELELKDEVIHLETGDSFVISAGVEHNPVAKEECLVMLIEKKATLHTGNISHPQSKSIEAQLKPIVNRTTESFCSIPSNVKLNIKIADAKN